MLIRLAPMTDRMAIDDAFASQMQQARCSCSPPARGANNARRVLVIPRLVSNS